MASTASGILEKLLGTSDWLRRITEGWPEQVKQQQELLTPMDKKSFVKFAKWLANCKGDIGDYAAFEQKLAEALVDKSTYSQRMNQIVSRIFDILIFDLVPSADTEEAAKLGPALVHILNCLAMSASADEVRVRPAPNKDVCVLVLGFAGSHVDEVQPQVEFYSSLGYATISATRCIYPHLLHIRQLVTIAQALRENLTRDTKLIVHCVSGNGSSLWGELCFRWLAGLTPFNELPPIDQCLKGLILECTPPAAMSPETGVALPPIGTPFYEECGGDGQWADMQQYKNNFNDSQTVFITLGSIGNMCQNHCKDVNFHSLSSTKPALMSFIRAAGQGQWFYKPEDVPAGYCPWNWFTLWDNSFESVCENLDISLFGGRLPKLLLTTAKDIVIPAELVEAYAAYLRKFWPEDSISFHKCKEAAHCKLWISDEREDCVKVVTQLLEVAGVLKPACDNPPN